MPGGNNYNIYLPGGNNYLPLWIGHSLLHGRSFHKMLH
jgi:hypothetical protein